MEEAIVVDHSTIEHSTGFPIVFGFRSKDWIARIAG